MNRAVRKFGWIAFLVGAIGFGIALILGQKMSYSTQELIGYGVMGMTAALVYFGVAYYRDTVNGGKLTFGDALKTGLLIAGLGALGMALIDIFFTTFINPNFFAEYSAYQIQMAEESGNNVLVEQARESNKLYEEMDPTALSFLGGAMMFFMTFVLGAVVAVISGFILKKK